MYNLEDRKDIRSTFLNKDVKLMNEGQYDPSKVCGYIYCITNKLNGKIYIGRTTNLNIRSSAYVKAALNDDTYSDGDSSRRINAVIKAAGIENFEMKPIWACTSELDIARMEYYFIHTLKSYKKEYGYNDMSYIQFCTPSDSARKKMSDAHMGLKMNAHSKKSKSRQVFCINYDTSKIVIADSLKLAGIPLDSSKDVMSHAALKGQKVRGYYLMYLHKDSLYEALRKVKERYEKRQSGSERRGGYILGKDAEYENTVNAVIDYIKTGRFVFKDFEITNIEYADNEDGYTITKITPEQIVVTENQEEAA